MIERLYLKELVTFKEVELEFEKGLVVFTGPSGAGKSVLISSILSSFGYTTQGVASFCEILINKPKNLNSESYNFDDEFTIKTLKRDNLRYFMSEQSISKKLLHSMFSPYVQYLSVRDRGGFKSNRLIEMIDNQLMQKDKTYKKSLKEYKKRYLNYKVKVDKLQQIKNDEIKLAEKIEFINYEIDKINNINPKVDEVSELIKVKQQLSRIDKIKDALSSANEIFNYESSVEEVFKLLDNDITGFSDTMNQLRSNFEEAESLADELEEVNVEEVLDRLSDLTILKNRYGSIEDALLYRDIKVDELNGYKNIEQDKSMLESFLQIEFSELSIIASRISQSRKKEAIALEKILKVYLDNLKLPAMKFIFEQKLIMEFGTDNIDVMLGTSKTDTLSGGEFNRLRLALMAVTLPKDETNQGILILDEIDANVSGDESIAIADMICKLSKVYQIFAISHQPHLSAKAQQHIVITKSKTESRVSVLGEEQRVNEIARIIAGENPTTQALEFAKRLRES